jgi:hypothetical protein
MRKSTRAKVGDFFRSVLQESVFVCPLPSLAILRRESALPEQMTCVLLKKSIAMATIELVFQGSNFPVPKNALKEFLHYRPDLSAATTYTVQSPVPARIFRQFVDGLSADTKAAVTNGNALFMLLLANEFRFPALISECAAHGLQSHSDLSNRVLRLEELIGSHERQIESLSTRFPSLQTDIASIGTQTQKGLQGLKSWTESVVRELRAAFDELKGTLSATDGSTRPVGSLRPPIIVPSSPKARAAVTCPMPEVESVNGIISYLTKKHGGNVHAKGIVTITSKSVSSLPGDNHVHAVADVDALSQLTSQDAPGQWVCWDFRDLRVRPSHYTLDSFSGLQSWVVEGSVDGLIWQEMHRETGSTAFPFWKKASFAMRNSVECRFIRLTQTGPRRAGGDSMTLCAAEFFGILFE